MRAKISVLLKSATVICAFFGIILSFINATSDGYYHFATRLLYFTALSNIWIALTFIAMLATSYVKSLSKSTRVKNSLYILRYVFTVSITLTGFIFCVLLGPSAKHDGYNAWTLSSVITHAVVPTLSIIDFFVDSYRVRILKKHMLSSLLPPFIYMVFVLILGVCNVDFGRGDPYPYPFFNMKSPAGFFGFSNQMPYIVGTFYWLLFMLAFIISIGAFYRWIYNKQSKAIHKNSPRI